jgi:hypothetical protein
MEKRRKLKFEFLYVFPPYILRTFFNFIYTACKYFTAKYAIVFILKLSAFWGNYMQERTFSRQMAEHK